MTPEPGLERFSPILYSEGWVFGTMNWDTLPRFHNNKLQPQANGKQNGRQMPPSITTSRIYPWILKGGKYSPYLNWDTLPSPLQACASQQGADRMADQCLYLLSPLEFLHGSKGETNILHCCISCKCKARQIQSHKDSLIMTKNSIL